MPDEAVVNQEVETVASVRRAPFADLRRALALVIAAMACAGVVQAVMSTRGTANGPVELAAGPGLGDNAQEVLVDPKRPVVIAGSEVAGSDVADPEASATTTTTAPPAATDGLRDLLPPILNPGGPTTTRATAPPSGPATTAPSGTGTVPPNSATSTTRPANVSPGTTTKGSGTTTKPPSTSTTKPTSTTTKPPSTTSKPPTTPPPTTPPTTQPPSGPTGPEFSKPCSCPVGNKTLTVRLRTTAGTGRIWLTVNGQRAGEWPVTTTSKTVSSVVFVPENATVGARSVAQNGRVATVVIESFVVGGAPNGFTTRGRWILDPSGTIFKPYGVNRAGFEYNQYGAATGDTDARWIAAWGANAVRIPVSEQFGVKGSCHYDPRYIERVAEEVDILTSKGLYVLVDNHNSMGGASCGAAKLREAPDDFAVPFLAALGARFRNNPLVGFDLYNEPRKMTDQQWRNGGTVAGYHSPGMQALYDAVRSSGATNVVWISGNSYANDLRPALTMPIDGYGIIYAAHTYCFGCGRPLPLFMDTNIAPVIDQYPVAIAEFGDVDNDGGAYNQRVMNWADNHGIGWLAYDWSTYSDKNGYGLLRLGTDHRPSPNGTPIRDALFAYRGWIGYGGGLAR